MTSTPPVPAWPLSLAQERLWLHDLYAPRSTRYNSPVLLHLRGPADPDRLASALEGLATNQAQLRVRILVRDGVPMQEARPPAGPWLETTRLPAGTSLEDALAAARQAAERPFDLGEEPPMRAHLFPFADDEAVLMLLFHHHVVDAESLRVILRDVGERYADDGTGAALEAPTATYRDYVEEERALVGTDEARSALNERADALLGVPGLALPSPLDPLPAASGPGPRVETFPRELRAQITDAARAFGVTPFVVLMAASMAQLARHTGQHRFIVATPVSRRRRRYRDVVGFFVDTEVLLLDVSSAETRQQWCQHVQGEVLRALAGPPMPLQLLVQQMRARGVRDWASTLGTLVSYEGHGQQMQWGDVAVRRCSDAVLTGSVFDLQLGWWDNGADLGVTVQHRSDVVDTGTLDRLIDQHAAELAAFTSTPGLPTPLFGPHPR